MIRFLATLVALTFLTLTAGPAPAFIKVDQPLSAITGASSQILVGKVKAIDVAGKRITITIERSVKAPKGTAPPAGDFAVQIDEPAEVLKQAAVGQPVVVFEAAKGVLLHLADDWVQAERAAPKVWRAFGKHEAARGFPGRTMALVQVLDAQGQAKKTLNKGRDSFTATQLKELGNPLLDMFEHSNWSKQYSLGDLGVKATHIAAADVDGDKKADLIAITSAGPKFYKGGGARMPFTDATAASGLAGAKGRQAAFGDVNGDGKPDLLLEALWLNQGGNFVQSKIALPLTDKDDVLAVALTDVTGDGKRDAVALCKDGTLLVLENPGAPDQPWKARPVKQLWTGGEPPLAAHFGDFGDNGKPHVMVIRATDIVRHALDDSGGTPADYPRLTGHSREARYFPIKDYMASAAFDLCGGDGRLDLVIATRSGKPRDVVLCNRGYGAFWPNNEAGVGGKGLRAVAMTAADLYGDGSWELLVATEDGKLIQIDSPPYKRGAPVE